MVRKRERNGRKSIEGEEEGKFLLFLIDILFKIEGYFNINKNLEDKRYFLSNYILYVF